MPTASDRIGLDFISGLGMPPVEFIGLAADLHCRHIGLAVRPIVLDEKNYATWSLRDKAVFSDVRAALRQRGVSIAVGEGFFIQAGNDIGDYGQDMDIMRELGALGVNSLSFDTDYSRSLDQFGRFAEMATERGMKAMVEFVPGMLIKDLRMAMDLVAQIGNPNFGLVIDLMHLVRSGSTAADLAALDPSRIFHAQLCDVPLTCTYQSYGYEAAFERLPPNEGGLPLANLLAALPSDITVGLEIPMLAKSQAGIGPHARLAPCVAAALAMLA